MTTHPRDFSSRQRSSNTAPLLVGVDVGTTNVKAVVFEPDGREVGCATTPTIIHVPRPGWATNRADEFWRQTVSVLRTALAQVDDPHRVAAISIASMAEAGVPLDANNEPTTDMIAWYDTRSWPQAEWLGSAFGADQLFATTGLSLQPIFSIFKMLWLREHEVDAWRRTVRWLHVSDYLAHRLGAEHATSHSIASRTMAFDLHRRTWDERILSVAEIDPTLFAPLIAEGTAIGTVSRAAAEATRLPQGAIISVGGHDHLCGAFASGVTDPGIMLESLGTTDTVLLPVEQPLTDTRFGREGFSQGAHVVADLSYVFGGQYTLGACIEWFRTTFAPGSDYAALLAEASTVPPGSNGVCFLPHLRLANPPYVDARSRGAFVGLSTDSSRAVMFRALLEGLAFEARIVTDALLSYEGLPSQPEARAIGGVTRNDLLMMIRATVRNQPIRVLEINEATALGAALLGGIAAGVYSGVADAVAAVQHQRRLVEPDPGHVPIYDEIFDRVYRTLYPILSPVSHSLLDIEDNRMVATARSESSDVTTSLARTGR